MKNLFLAIREQLKTLSGINWIDMDKGQLEASVRPVLAYPAALITVSFPNINDANDEVDVFNASIVVRLVFDNAQQRTSGEVPQDAVEESLSYLDIEEAVYQVFRGFEPTDWSVFSCRERQPEATRADGLVVMRLRWESTSIQA